MPRFGRCARVHPFAYRFPLSGACQEEEARLAAEKKAEDEKNLEKFAEDGLPGAFCYEIRGYSAPQLRLILAEQKDEYTPEEFAFIKKVLAEKA